MKQADMFRIVLLAATASLLPSLAATAVAAPTCEKTFDPTGGSTGDWAVGANWDPTGTPTSTDVACIPAGKTANIPYVSGTPATVEAEAIWIKRSGATRGVVNVGVTNTLEISEDSQIDGDLTLDFPLSSLIITDQVPNLTITGDGGEIICGNYYGFPEELAAPVIDTLGKRRLVLTGGGTRATSLVVRGNVKITAKLTNDAYIVADDSTFGVFSRGDLVLAGPGLKTGSGYWIAEGNSTEGTVGRFRVDTAVTGSGTWILEDDIAAEIVINAACPSLTGDVKIHKGRLIVNATFATTGALDMKSTGGSKPKIEVATGVVVDFD